MVDARPHNDLVHMIKRVMRVQSAFAPPSLLGILSEFLAENRPVPIIPKGLRPSLDPILEPTRHTKILVRR